MSDILPPPSTSIPAVEDERGKTMDFTPVWRKWFIDLADILNKSGGTEGFISATTNITGQEPIVVTGNLRRNNIEISVTEFTSNKSGVVPNSNGGTENFLRADGVWAAPPGGPSSSSHNSLTGLQGGTIGEYYHLTAAQAASIGPTSTIDGGTP